MSKKEEYPRPEKPEEKQPLREQVADLNLEAYLNNPAYRDSRKYSHLFKNIIYRTRINNLVAVLRNENAGFTDEQAEAVKKLFTGKLAELTTVYRRDKAPTAELKVAKNLAETELEQKQIGNVIDEAGHKSLDETLIGGESAETEIEKLGRKTVIDMVKFEEDAKYRLILLEKNQYLGTISEAERLNIIKEIIGNHDKIGLSTAQTKALIELANEEREGVRKLAEETRALSGAKEKAGEEELKKLSGARKKIEELLLGLGSGKITPNGFRREVKEIFERQGVRKSSENFIELQIVREMAAAGKISEKDFDRLSLRLLKDWEGKEKIKQ